MLHTLSHWTLATDSSCLSCRLNTYPTVYKWQSQAQNDTGLISQAHARNHSMTRCRYFRLGILRGSSKMQVTQAALHNNGKVHMSEHPLSRLPEPRLAVLLPSLQREFCGNREEYTAPWRVPTITVAVIISHATLVCLGSQGRNPTSCPSFDSSKQHNAMKEMLFSFFYCYGNGGSGTSSILPRAT